MYCAHAVMRPTGWITASKKRTSINGPPSVVPSGPRFAESAITYVSIASATLVKRTVVVKNSRYAL
jgi:hypothetical protein